MNDRLWEDYANFHGIQTYSLDMDPIYPILQEFNSDLSVERGLWLTFLYVSYYNLGSALRVFSIYQEPVVPPEQLLKLPCGTERRGHRTPLRLAMHLDSICVKAEKHGGLHPWISSFIVEGDPIASWKSVNAELQTVWGNGRWAAYKTCEILWKCNGFPLAAPDMGHENSSGPRHGLSLLYGNNLPTGNTPGEIEHLDGLSLDVVGFLQERGLTAAIETAETSLCDFHALHEGRYYSGINIDEIQEALNKIPSDLTFWAFSARQKRFPHEYLGEISGWDSVDKARKEIYRKTRQIPEREKL